MPGAACVHLHLYQPPRQSPWTGLVDAEPTAFPQRDWNARIAAESYRPNAAARVLAADGTVSALDDNYARTSWNAVPVLHAWFETDAPDVDLALREADRAGGGALRPALASPAIHAILPLARPEDARLLVAWGIADFRRRFGREPEGMWLPECAADTASLEALAAAGIRFTLLMPQQARRVRPPGGGAWQDVSGERLDPTRAYRVALPSGRSLDVVFGHGPLSRGISFDGMLGDGHGLADSIAAALARGAGELVALVTDGETFGHHHRFGEMGLAAALRALAERGIEATTPAAWLEAHPPAWEVELYDPSSWSCAHGVERWRSGCGCVTGGEPGWRLEWRAPLRAAVDWLVDATGARVRDLLGGLVVDADEALVAYGEVVCGAADAVEHAVARVAGEPLPDRVRTVATLLEAQRHALAATTSCGWFFADPAGVETAIVLRHAARAAELLCAATGDDLEPGLIARLADVRSNDPARGAGRAIWDAALAGARRGTADAAATAALRADAGLPARRGGDLETELEETGPRVWRVRARHRRTGEEATYEVRAEGEGLAVAATAGGGSARGLADVDGATAAAVACARLGAPGDPVLALRLLAHRLRTHALDAASAAALGALLEAAAPVEGDAAAAAMQALVAARAAAGRVPGGDQLLVPYSVRGAALGVPLHAAGPAPITRQIP